MPSYHFLKTEIELCTISCEGFKVLSTKIIQSLAENGSSYFKEFLNQISLIITSKHYAPTSRFYALYLLFKASTELKDELLLELLKETDLLAFIHYTAQYESSRKISLDERGREFFTQSPTKNTSRIGVNFVRLCLEMLTFWDQRYVINTPGHPSHLFRLYAKSLSKKIKLPQFYFFIEKSYDLAHDLATWDFSLKFPAASEKAFSNVDDNHSELKVIIKNEENELLCCESPHDKDNIAGFEGSFSTQAQMSFNLLSEKMEPSETKQNLFEEPLPASIILARHQSEPPQINLEEKTFTISRAKNHHFTVPSRIQITKSRTYEQAKLLSDLDEIGISIKRSMNSFNKLKASLIIEDTSPEKISSLSSNDEKSPRKTTASNPKNAFLGSLRLPYSVQNIQADENIDSKRTGSSRRHFPLMKKESNVNPPSCSSIWFDKEEAVESNSLKICRNQTTSNAQTHRPTFKKSSSTLPASFLDFESQYKMNQAFEKTQESGSTAQVDKIQFERKKYDPFLRERLVEPC